MSAIHPGRTFLRLPLANVRFRPIADIQPLRHFGRMFTTFQCALCMKPLKLDHRFRAVRIITSDGFREDDEAPSQELVCHSECLEQALGENVPIL